MFKHLTMVLSILLGANPASAQDTWPALPTADGAVEIPAQEWPLRPGPRKVRVLVHYPGGKSANVTKDTGIMLTLHNWGGVDCVGTANPRELANKLNVIALCVNYLQSGKESIDGPEPYDFGYLQALDALRALYFAFNHLKTNKTPFAEGRIYCTGGSGGGNVTLMANKLAPRTFACIVDLCGMAKLSDDIAFNLPGGTDLDARYSRDPKSKNYLSLDHQEMRYLGNPDHLAVMKSLGSSAKIVVVHGIHDKTCPFADTQEMVAWMKRAGLDVYAYPVSQNDIDGKVFTSSGHALGDRTKIVFQVAGKYLEPASRSMLARKGPTDFERGDEIRYPTSNGAFVISFKKSYPVGRFEAGPKTTDYPDHTDVTHYRRAGKSHPIKTIDDWQIRRRHIVENLQRVMGPLPGPLQRVPLAIKIVEEKKFAKFVRRKITYQSDPDDRVPAYVFLPVERPAVRLPAMLCLHQTTKAGKDEPAGITGNPDLKYALELAERGYIAVVPDYPSFGEHKFDFKAKPAYVSGSMKAIWDNIRAVDVLETIPEVDMERVGVIGHSLGGHNAMFTAVFEPRIRAVVSSCGFTTFRKDDMPSWTGPVYMPRIKTQFGNDAKKVPFDFQEIVASFAPRAFLACAAEKDDDFDVSGVRDVITAAAPIYRLLNAEKNLSAFYPSGPHAFPPAARKYAYEFLDSHLKK